jgi:hypothetical protein
MPSCNLSESLDRILPHGFETMHRREKVVRLRTGLGLG